MRTRLIVARALRNSARVFFRCANGAANQGKSMTKRHARWFIGVALTALVLLGVAALRSREAQAQGQYPMVDMIANKIVQKYTSSTCEQLWIKKSEHTPPSMEEQRAITILRNDPQMRAEFIGKIAAPIANKMFDCGMVP
jgi:hypothetical protein